MITDDFNVWLSIQKVRNKKFSEILSSNKFLESLFLDCWNTSQYALKESFSAILEESNFELECDFENLKEDFHDLQFELEGQQSINENLKSRICFLEEQLKDRDI